MNAAQEREIRAVKAHGQALAQRREDRLAGRDRPARPATPWQSYMRKIEIRADGVWLNAQWIRSLLDPFDGAIYNELLGRSVASVREDPGPDPSGGEICEELMGRSGATIREDSGTKWIRAHAVAALFDTGALGPNYTARLRIMEIHEAGQFGDELRSARVFRDRQLVDAWHGKVFLSQVVEQVRRHDAMIEKVEMDFECDATQSFGKEILRRLPLEFGILQKLGGELPEMLLWIRKIPAVAGQ